MYNPQLSVRQAPPPDDCHGDCCGDWCNSGQNVKYGVVGGIIALIVLWVFIGAVHARHRVKRGKSPLFYHRWFVASQTTTQPYHGQPQYAPYGMHSYWGNANSYRNRNHEMNAWAPPPPAYSSDAPPTYQPPPDKRDANATTNQVGGGGTGAQESSTSVEARGRAQEEAANPNTQDSTVQRPQPVHQGSENRDRFA